LNEFAIQPSLLLQPRVSVHYDDLETSAVIARLQSELPQDLVELFVAEWVLTDRDDTLTESGVPSDELGNLLPENKHLDLRSFRVSFH
jgi:hypothetical protein